VISYPCLFILKACFFVSEGVRNIERSSLSTSNWVLLGWFG